MAVAFLLCCFKNFISRKGENSGRVTEGNSCTLAGAGKLVKGCNAVPIRAKGLSQQPNCQQVEICDELHVQGALSPGKETLVLMSRRQDGPQG